MIIYTSEFVIDIFPNEALINTIIIIIIIL